jgi:alpha-glycerophosphate oxidase
MRFGYENRAPWRATLEEETIDLLIIGGGITGAGVAVAAAASGLRTVLVEMQDFAAGTSSRSTKLVHGGIRYLKTFDVDVVADTVSERANIQKIAPHIAQPTMMLLPVYDEPDATYDMFELEVAMDLYDRLAKVTNPNYTHRVLTKEEVIAYAPEILQDNLLGGGLYLDYRNDDARLVIENMKRAATDGAMLLSRTKALEITHDDEGIVNGAKVRDLLTGDEYHITARIVINTAGPWVDAVRALDRDNEFLPEIRPTKGVHLTVDATKLSVSQPTYFDTGKGDGRMVFVIPRQGKTYFGTTDTDYTGDYVNPLVEQVDVDYLLSVINYRFPQANITVEMIESSWAGLRPLIASHDGGDYNGKQKATVSKESFDAVVAAVVGYTEDASTRGEVEQAIITAAAPSKGGAKNPSQVSRGSTLERSRDGLLTLAGGKITDYRLMAEGALILIAQLMHDLYHRDITLVDTTNYPISGGELDAFDVERALADLASEAEGVGFSPADANYLAHLYGSNLPIVLTYDATFAGMSRCESTSLNYSLHEEMTLTPVDFLLRRTSHLLFMSETVASLKQPVVDAMAAFYNWSEAEKQQQLTALDTAIERTDLQYLK